MASPPQVEQSHRSSEWTSLPGYPRVHKGHCTATQVYNLRGEGKTLPVYNLRGEGKTLQGDPHVAEDIVLPDLKEKKMQYHVCLGW